jgi:hypothetical protein
MKTTIHPYFFITKKQYIYEIQIKQTKLSGSKPCFYYTEKNTPVYETYRISNEFIGQYPACYEHLQPIRQVVAGNYKHVDTDRA